MTRRIVVEVDAYRVAAEAVERGVEHGWHRAHKHVDDPSPEDLRAAIADAVMTELSEYFWWPERDA